IEVLLKLCNLDSRNARSIDDTQRSREALKCLSNCALLKDATRLWIVKHGGVPASYRLLASPVASGEAQFLVCRVLLFLTVDAPDVVEELVSLGIGPTIAKVLDENVTKFVSNDSQSGPNQISPKLVISEALKLLFNLILVETRRKEGKEEEIGAYFSGCLAPIYTIVFDIPISKPMPLSPPTNYAVQALMQFPFSAIYNSWSNYVHRRQNQIPSEALHNICANRMCDILEGTLNYLIPDGNPDNHASTSSEQNVDATIAPLVLVMRKVMAEDPGFRESFMSRLLPSERYTYEPLRQQAVELDKKKEHLRILSSQYFSFLYSLAIGKHQ
ncbi:guanine nucleotide exchange factor, partial [Dichotomocladium elegans]